MSEDDWNDDAIHFNELFAVAARQVLRAAWRRPVDLSFDCKGPPLVLRTDEVQLRCALHRLLRGAVDVLEAGHLVLEASTRSTSNGRVEITVTAAGKGSLARDDLVAQALAGLELSEVSRRSTGEADRSHRLLRARGRCAITGARISFSSSPSAGFLLRARWSPRGAPLPTDDGPPPDARGARAWLVGGEAAASASLAHRLERLGWSVTRLDSCEDALRRLRGMKAHHWRPQLVVALESRRAALAELPALRASLPEWSRCIGGVFPGSAALPDVERDPSALEVLVAPFSAAELERLTRDLFPGPRPSPERGREPPRRPLALIVDDDEIHRLVSTAMVRSLGWDAVSACDGEEALAHCERLHPDVVLLDLAMPVMDGLDVARELRRRERAGRQPPIAIIATTARDPEGAMPACEAAGLDGFLAKPLAAAMLAAELRRLCAGCLPAVASRSLPAPVV